MFLTIAATKILFFIAVVKHFGCNGNLKFTLTYNGKSENLDLLLYHCRYFDKVLQKCSWSSPLQTIWILSKSLILIGCHGNLNARFSKKILKNLLIRSHKGDEAETFHKCLCYYPLHKLCVLLLLRMSFFAMATLSFHRFIMEKVKVGLIFSI